MKLIRSYIAVLMCGCILSGTLAIPSIYIDFEIRKDYIAKVLCINKDKPITVCGGKCYVTKRLQKTAQQNEQQEQNTKPGIRINFDQPVTDLLINFSSGDVISREFAITTQDFHIFPFYHDIFHPPQNS